MKTISNPTPIATTTKRIPTTIPTISPSDTEDCDDGVDVGETEPVDVEEEVGTMVEVEMVEVDVTLQLFTPTTHVPLLHVSFKVQALESLQGVPFGSTEYVHCPVEGSHPVTLRH